MSTRMKVFLALAVLVVIVGVVLLATLAVDVNSLAAGFDPIQIAGGTCSSTCTSGG